ncbi:superoxide dismutase, partial [Crossiella sp. NPDC003009]
INALWNIVDWTEVGKRFEDARAGKNGLLLP